MMVSDTIHPPCLVVEVANVNDPLPLVQVGMATYASRKRYAERRIQRHLAQQVQVLGWDEEIRIFHKRKRSIGCERTNAEELGWKHHKI